MFKAALLSAVVGLCGLGLNARTQWYNPLDGGDPYISGRAWNAEQKADFARMPERMQAVMPKKVWNLSRNSAGLSVRFLTTSETITVKYTLESQAGWKNMAPINHSGIDLYSRDVNGNQHWVGNHMAWHFGDTVSVTFSNLKPRNAVHRGLEYEVFLPPYNTVTSMQIGVDEGSKFRFLEESAERPIVIYGSSIVQGASPSRPGLMWATQVKRHLDYPVVNLGFSGSAYMEPALFEAMGEITARAYVLDPMPNSYRLGEDIYNRMVAGVKYLRGKNSAPILLVEHAGAVDSITRRDIGQAVREGNAWLRKAYDALKASGIDNIYYLSSREIGMDEDSYIEGVHPNDIGNRLQALAVERKLREMMPEDTPNRRYPPIRQRRDACYTWWERHNDVIRLNHTTDPDVLCIGNSITHFWGGEPVSRNNGGDTWQKMWGKRKAVNMGFGWDRIENVFWRINHGELEGCSPKEIYLLIGINNVAAGDSEEDVARGIVDLSAAIRARQPQAVLNVIKIYPAKGREEKVARTNELIEKYLPVDKHLRLLDLNACLVMPDGSGKVNPEMFLEGLHPNEKGYAALAKELKKQLRAKK